MSRLCPDPDPVFPYRCRACGRLCVPIEGGRWRHFRPRCNAWMPVAHEFCYRFDGHLGDHRTIFAVKFDRERSLQRARARAA